MLKYLKPLGVFLGGQVFILFLWLLFPAIGSATSALATSTSAHAATFWGWSWVVSSTRLIIYIMAELFITISALVTFLKVKSS